MLYKCITKSIRHAGMQRTFSWKRYIYQNTRITKHKVKHPVLDGSVDSSSTTFISNRNASEVIRDRYNAVLKVAQSGGSAKAIDRHVNRNQKLLATQRLQAMLDQEGDWLELGTLTGLGMEYGDIPRAGVITGIGQVNGLQCIFVINDATVKGGTIYPISVKKQLRAQEVAKQNRLPCIYIVDSGGAFLPLQADIFPDKEHGGRAFYNEAIMNSMGIPQVAIVCGSCTAGGAYVPTMCQEAIIVDQIGTIFLGGPHLVYAALGEVVSSEDLGGATLHSSVSGCTDHFARDEKEAFEMGRGVVDTFSVEPVDYPANYDEPLFDISEMPGLIPHTDQHLMDIRKIKIAGPGCASFSLAHDYPRLVPRENKLSIICTKVLARVVDGSRMQEFKARYGTTLFTAFADIEGHRVGVIGNNGPLTGDAASKGAHFVQLCDQRRVPIVFLQNTTPARPDGGPVTDLRMHARLMAAVACCTVPKLTIIVGNSFGAENYLMAGRSFDPRFVFSWPNARIGAADTASLMNLAIQAGLPGGTMPTGADGREAADAVQVRLDRQTSALYAASRLWDDGIILPVDTRKVLGNLLRIVNQSRRTWVHQESAPSVVRL